MPHIVVEYSANIRDRIDLPGLIDALHATAIATGVFPPGGTRTRAAERTHYRIADGHPENAFVHVAMTIGAGRDAATKQRAAQAVFDALVAHLAPLYDSSPLGLSLELRESDPALSFKRNNLHDYVKARQAGKEMVWTPPLRRGVREQAGKVGPLDPTASKCQSGKCVNNP